MSTPVSPLRFPGENPVVSRNDRPLEATRLLYNRHKNLRSCNKKHLSSLHTCGSGGSSWAWHRSLPLASLLPGPGLAQHVFLVAMTEVPSRQAPPPGYFQAFGHVASASVPPAESKTGVCGAGQGRAQAAPKGTGSTGRA